MGNVWAIAKELKLNFSSLEEIAALPYTISYVVRKQMQIVSFNELPKEKRPPDTLVWWGTPEELDNWLDKVFDIKNPISREVLIREDEIE